MIFLVRFNLYPLARFFNDREGKTEKASSHRQPAIWTSGPVLIGQHHYPHHHHHCTVITPCYSEPDIHDRHSLVSQHLVNSSGGGSRVGSSRASSRSSQAHSQVKVKSISQAHSQVAHCHVALCYLDGEMIDIQMEISAAVAFVVLLTMLFYIRSFPCLLLRSSELCLSCSPATPRFASECDKYSNIFA